MGRAGMVLESPVGLAPDALDGDVDTDLVAAVRRGDDRAFEELYTRYQRRISAYVFGMVKDHGRAEDVTQEVFMSALRRMRETDRAIAFKPWIYEIAKNACIDQFRRSRRADEVSFDAGEGLAGADHGRLVASEPSPDAAVDAKQQLEQLCGAFGGLSDAHHEILVLREFEGLSYHEIGDRMGLSRPGVESTLFRARKRLSEEYDELVSGQRCVRVQAIIAATESAVPGARDARRLARHLAHCQPCRRQAAASGLDVAALARKPLRKRAAERIGALLPLPGFLRSRLWPAGEHVASVSEPMAAGWSKAAAVAATLLVVGVGTGSVPQKSSDTPDPQTPKAAAVAPDSPAAATRAARARALAAPASPTETTKRRAGRRDSTRKSASQRQPAGAPGANAPAGGGAGSSPTSANSPAGANTGGSGSTPTRKPSSGGAVNLPAATQPVTDQVDKTVQQTGEAVTNTVGGVTDTVDQTTDTVDQAADTVGGPVGGTVGGTAGDTVGDAGDTVDEVVDGTTGAVGDAVDDVTDGLPNLGG